MVFSEIVGKTYHGILMKDFIATIADLYTILKEQGFWKNKDFNYKLFDSFPLHYWLQYTLLWVRTGRNAYCTVQKQWSAWPQYAKLHCRVCISNLGRNMAMHLARAAIPEEHNNIFSKNSPVSNGLHHMCPHKSVELFWSRSIREFQNERRSQH